MSNGLTKEEFDELIKLINGINEEEVGSSNETRRLHLEDKATDEQIESAYTKVSNDIREQIKDIKAQLGEPEGDDNA